MAGAAEHPRIIESSVAVAAATGARLCSLIRNTSQLVLSRLVLRITRRYFELSTQIYTESRMLKAKLRIMTIVIA